MSLYVYNRPVSRTELENNFRKLHDFRNFAPVAPVYSPPSTVGMPAVTANEVVFRAGKAIADEKKINKEMRLRRIRLLLKRQRREKELHNKQPPSVNPTSSLSVVRNPDMGYA
jgi:hypothetical protein